MRKPEDTTYLTVSDKLREEHRQFEVEHWKKQCYERTAEIQRLKGRILELEFEIVELESKNDELRKG